MGDLFVVMCPTDDPTSDSLPSSQEDDGDALEVYFSNIKLTVLYLIVNQFAENLRQAEAFVRRTWQYLASALPDFDPETADWDVGAAAEEWEQFQSRCAHVRHLQTLLLYKVAQDFINYADVQDTFSMTTVTPPLELCTRYGMVCRDSARTRCTRRHRHPHNTLHT